MWGLVTRLVDAGCTNSLSVGLTGRVTKFPPQLGQVLSNLFSAHSLQNVHSNVQIRASLVPGGKSLSQHSQLGLSKSKIRFL